MRKLISMLLALLLVALPALAENWNPYDYTDDITGDGCPIYYFADLSLKLPQSWRGKVFALRNDGGVAFHQEASYRRFEEAGMNGGGFLFQLYACEDESYRDRLPAYRDLGYSERSHTYYALLLPSEYDNTVFEGDESGRAEYDELFGQIDFVVENASFYPAEGGTASPDEKPTGGDAQPTEVENGEWTPQEVRYAFEQSMLPNLLYNMPEQVLTSVRSTGVFRLWEMATEENNIELTYPDWEFGEHWYTNSDGDTLLQATMPWPTVTPQCFRIYFAYNGATGIRSYFTAEYDNLLGDACLICGRDLEGNHTVYGEVPVTNPADEDYEAALRREAATVAELAGISSALTPADGPAFGEPVQNDKPDVNADSELAVIECPEQGFTTLANPSYYHEFDEGNGLMIYTGEGVQIPYVIINRVEDLLADPFEAIRERYTPYVQDKYGDALLEYDEYADYEIGGKELPAGVYTYRLDNGIVIDMIRIFDSTGKQTVVYTAKFRHGEDGTTLAALDAAIRGFKAD